MKMMMTIKKYYGDCSDDDDSDDDDDDDNNDVAVMTAFWYRVSFQWMRFVFLCCYDNGPFTVTLSL